MMSEKDKIANLKELKVQAEFTIKVINNWLLEAEVVNLCVFGVDSVQYSEHEIYLIKVISEIKSRYDEIFSNLLENTNRSIISLGLPNRCLNPLLAANVDTVGDVFQIGREGLLLIRNFGPKSLEILENKLIEQGFRVPWLDE